jgi:hypothetical protein
MAIEIKTLNGDSPLNETVKKSHNLINFPIKNSIFTIRLRRIHLDRVPELIGKMKCAHAHADKKTGHQ